MNLFGLLMCDKCRASAGPAVEGAKGGNAPLSFCLAK